MIILNFQEINSIHIHRKIKNNKILKQKFKKIKQNKTKKKRWAQGPTEAIGNTSYSLWAHFRTALILLNSIVIIVRRNILIHILIVQLIKTYTASHSSIQLI